MLNLFQWHISHRPATTIPSLILQSNCNPTWLNACIHPFLTPTAVSGYPPPLRPAALFWFVVAPPGQAVRNMQAKPFVPSDGRPPDMLSAILSQRQRYVNPTPLNYLGSTLAFEVANAMVRCMVPAKQLLEVDLHRDGADAVTLQLKRFLNFHENAAETKYDSNAAGPHDHAGVANTTIPVGNEHPLHSNQHPVALDPDDKSPCRHLRGRWLSSTLPHVATKQPFSTASSKKRLLVFAGEGTTGTRFLANYSAHSQKGQLPLWVTHWTSLYGQRGR